jgi:hypothetical protein
MKKNLFKRDISTQFDLIEENLLRVRTSLQDVFHDILVILDVSLPNYVIESAKIDMNRVPSDRCFQVCPRASELVGLRVSKGFYNRLRRLFGGANGCVNVYQMLSVSAPLAINVSWYVYRDRGDVDDEGVQQLVERDMAGKCIAYPARPDSEH